MASYVVLVDGELADIGTAEEVGETLGLTAGKVRLLATPEARSRTPIGSPRFFRLGDFSPADVEVTMEVRDKAIARARDDGVTVPELSAIFNMSVAMVESALRRVDNGRYSEVD